jgi:glycosyltransferase involved in cell wall biosynthesis
MVVNTWSGDEPIVEVAAAAAELPEVTFEVTGHADARVARLGPLPPNVHFAGFLPDADYYDLMQRAQAVICLTTRDHTMQRGACEALSLGTPIITSDWPLLRSYFDRGTVHVDNTAPGIRDGVQGMMEHYDRYLDEIARLREVRRADWDARRAELVGLLQHAAASHSGRRRKPGGQG